LPVRTDDARLRQVLSFQAIRRRHRPITPDHQCEEDPASALCFAPWELARRTVNQAMGSSLTRRRLFQEAALRALATLGAYEAVSELQDAVGAASTVSVRRPEQHLLRGLKVETLSSGQRVIVPPIHHQLVTARVEVQGDRRSLQSAQQELEDVLRRIEAVYEDSTTGVGLTVAWGWPYFRRFVPELAASQLPIDIRLSRRRSRESLSLLDAIRFPSDPRGVRLEQNDVVFLFRSDNLAHVVDASEQIFKPLAEVFEITSVRKGFVGKGLPRARALAAGLAGAQKVDSAAPLFFGAYSLHPFGEGPGRIANVETLGYTRRADYFRHGTHMHLSHLFEDLARWYEAPPRRRGARLLGHAFAISRRTGLDRPVTGPDGAHYRPNAGIIQRAESNTLDNPFFWSADPTADAWHSQPAPGMHFVSFAPTSDEFNRYRFAMDGRDADGRKLPANIGADRDVASREFNRLIHASHRQNFIVPPRTHRSFPLVELIR
jgi:hypothetical protein